MQEKEREETNIKVAKLQQFNGSSRKVSRFIIVCKLYIKMRIRGVTVQKQIQCILSYVQERSVNIWKKNTLEDLKEGLLEYEIVGEFLANIKREFEGGDKEIVKVAELKKIEQGERTIEEFVQEFRRAAKGSRYKKRPLVKEFKKKINETIHQRFIESE